MPYFVANNGKVRYRSSWARKPDNRPALIKAKSTFHDSLKMAIGIAVVAAVFLAVAITLVSFGAINTAGTLNMVAAGAAFGVPVVMLIVSVVLVVKAFKFDKPAALKEAQKATKRGRTSYPSQIEDNSDSDSDFSSGGSRRSTPASSSRKVDQPDKSDEEESEDEASLQHGRRHSEDIPK